MRTVSTSSVALADAPRGVITALAHSTADKRLYVATIAGRVHVYNVANISDSSSLIPLFKWHVDNLIVSVALYEHLVILVHPNSVSVASVDEEVESSSFQCQCRQLPQCETSQSSEGVYIGATVVQYMSVILIASANGELRMYNLPDFSLLDIYTSTARSSIQTFDAYLNYVVVALSNGTNVILDISTRKFYHLQTQESGFKYPITTSLKIMHTIQPSQAHDFPYNLVYAQAGIEGKVSVVTTRVETQTEPTVTITTAALSAPVSSSIADNNPSGIVVASAEPSKFIFRAHRTTLRDGNVLVGPIYSLATIDGYLVTTGYGGNGKSVDTTGGGGGGGSTEGSVCFWDVEAKRRVKLCRGFSGSVVATTVWDGVVACASSYDGWKNRPTEKDDTIDAEESGVVLLVLG
jgi:hypothetical protein